MPQNRNKLRKNGGRKTYIITAVIFFLIVFAISIYVTYAFRCFEADNKAKISVDYIMLALNYLSNPTYSLPLTFDLFCSILKQQISIWYVYLGAALLLFIAFTTTVHGDYDNMEKGSARWADKYETKKFKDNTGIPLGDNFYASITGGKKGRYYKPHNLNECVIGGSGAGKTFLKIKPTIMQMTGSFIVTDLKGENYRDCAKMLKAHGYKVRVLNMIDIGLTNTYNPFVYMRNEQDVLSVADIFMQDSDGKDGGGDFWSGAAKDLLVAIMVYLFKSPSEMKCFGRVIRLVNSITYDDGKIDTMCELARCMKKHEIEHPNDAATVNWHSIQGTPEETMGGIAKTLSTKLGLWATEDVDEFTADDEMDLDSVGIEKTAIFLLIPPARNPYKAIINIFYTQLFERLMYIANFKYNGRLPMLVSCELDEFANCGKIPNFCETLTVVRSHNIRICIVLQGLSQLKAVYKDTWESILGNCSMFTYLGTPDTDTREYVVKRLGKTTVRTGTKSYSRGNQSGGSDNESFDGRDLLNLDELPIAMVKDRKAPFGYMIEFIDEFRPFFLNKFETLKHPLIGEVGSSFESGIPNNTNIADDYGGEKRTARTQKHKSKIAELMELQKKEAEEAEVQRAIEAEAQQKQLAESFEEDNESERIESINNNEEMPSNKIPTETKTEEMYEEGFNEDVEAFF